MVLQIQRYAQRHGYAITTETSTQNHNVNKGRLLGAHSKRRTAAERAFDNSVRREASGFEYNQCPEALATTAS
ncbi:hypothetical protein ABVK25_003604 [Lepraria finkii]|uniref:Uncharacterized protein n=1 Tax=Lepraria finkii TaxID=1340010 RepID=A0ABR4BDP6_9LECA